MPGNKKFRGNPASAEEYFNEQTQRTTCDMHTDFDDFNKWLFATLYSSNTGFDDTQEIVRELYKISSKGRKMGAIDAVAFALCKGYSSFEELLVSPELSDIVSAQIEPDYSGVYGTTKTVYYYALKHCQEFLRDSCIRDLRLKDYRSRSAVLLPDIHQLSLGPNNESLTHQTDSKKKREVQGEIFSYMVDCEDYEGANSETESAIDDFFDENFGSTSSLSEKFEDKNFKNKII